MRLLHVTDFHFNQAWFAWLAAAAPAYDLCCFTGDFIDLLLDWQSSPAGQARWVNRWLADFPTKLCTCSGNHDWWTTEPGMTDPDAEAGWLRRARRPGVLVDGDSQVMGGYRFVCKPWIGNLQLPQDHPIVLLAHGPPQGTGTSSDYSGEAGDFETDTQIRHLPRGSLILSGHIHNPRRWHEPIGLGTCFNPGFAREQSIPNHIVIDLDRRQAEFFSNGTKSNPFAY